MKAKKRIMFACGAGIVTSYAVRKKVEALLVEHGYRGKYEFSMHKIDEVVPASSRYDFLITTTMPPYGLKCPYVLATGYLLTKDTSDLDAEILRLMKA